MLCLDTKHGDIQEFLEAKLDLSELNNANVSVVFSENPEDFFARESNGDVWKKVVANALRSGEPGILNGYYANRMSNTWYIAPLESTNPCGEIWLSAYDCCCLGALVLPRFIQEKSITVDEGIRETKTVFNWGLLESAVHVAVRALDNVLTVNHYPLPRIAETCSGLRRIGLGVMGLHDMLLMMGLRYNSDEGLELVNKTLKFIKNAAYEASIELAKEKGAFPRFDAEKYLKGGFIRTLKPSIRSAIREHGIRNCALLTIAPTGTTSMVQSVTSGIEPMFAPAYRRRYRDGDDLKEEVVIHPLFKRFVEEGRSVEHFQGAHELSMRDHFEMQRVCQGHIDNAVSKTINVPQGTSADELSELYQEYLPHLKGVTIYPDGARENQPLVPMPLSEALEHVGARAVEAFAQDSCKDGKCDI
jgi:ribonucleoside-diphosphate reductase alpha chain